MRILHILDHSLPMHSGYSFRTRAIMKAQLADGLEVRGVTGTRHTAPADAEETVDGLHFHRTGPAALLPGPFAEWSGIQALAQAIDAVVETWRPDILHAHSPVLSALAGMLARKRHRLPLLYEIRAFWEDAAVGNGTGREGSLRYRATKALETHAVRRADAVAVICDGLKSDLVARGIDPAKIMVSPNGVDLDLFGEPGPRDASLARRHGLRDGRTIGFIGSFYDYEGLDDLIAAMPLLTAQMDGVSLLLVGGGPEEARLKALSAQSPAREAIHFAGRVPHAEVERYYSVIDVLVYPRKRMRLTDLVTPLKPLEAMAQRRLVAASDVGGHRELMEDGVTGSLFAPDDPKALADTVARLLRASGLWEARRDRAERFVREHRNWSSNISRYRPVYHKLTGRPV